jgi:hypothetical protein
VALSDLKEHFKRDLFNHQPVFDLALSRYPGNWGWFARHPGFGDHTTPFSVLAVFEDPSNERYAEKDDLTRALWLEHAMRPHRLWTRLLILGYLPMLMHLRSQLDCKSMGPNDLNQLVLTSFLEVLDRSKTLEKPDRLPLHLRQRTRYIVFQSLRHEEMVDESTALLDESLRRADFAVRENPFLEVRLGTEEPVYEDLCAAEDVVKRFVGDRVAPGDLDHVLKMMLFGWDLPWYLIHIGAYVLGVGAPGTTGYERYKRRRSRTLVRLRAFYRTFERPQLDEPDQSDDSPLLHHLEALAAARTDSTPTKSDAPSALRIAS